MFVIEAVFVVDVVAVVVETIVVTTSDGVVLVESIVVTTGSVENIDVAGDVAVDMSVLSVVAKIRSPTCSKQ